jgi:hypothetical protein
LQKNEDIFTTRLAKKITGTNTPAYYVSASVMHKKYLQL